MPKFDASPAGNLSTLGRYQVLDQIAGESLHELVQIIVDVCGMERGLVALLDPGGTSVRLLIGTAGLEATRVVPFVYYMVLQDGVVVVSDVRENEALAELPAASDARGVRLFAGAPLRGDDGRCLGVLCVFDSVPRELPARIAHIFAGLARQVEAQLRLRRRLDEVRDKHLGHLGTLQHLAEDIEQRKQLEQLKDEFISAVSHELRTPLTSILGALGLLLGGVAGELPAPVAELVGIARENGDQLLRLVNDLLDAQKLASGRFEVEVAPCDLRAVAARAVELTSPFAERHGVHLALEGDVAAPIAGDFTRLVQVVVNLVSNAVKFSPRGEAVRVAVVAGRVFARVSVADRGPGIPDSFRPRIFEKFAQASAADATHRGGTGLGLSIVKSIVELHGGRVRFDSDLGRGTVFHVELPVTQ